MKFEIEPIAVISNDYKEKFGIPRQSGLLPDTVSTIIFNDIILIICFNLILDKELFSLNL